MATPPTRTRRSSPRGTWWAGLVAAASVVSAAGLAGCAQGPDGAGETIGPSSPAQGTTEADPCGALTASVAAPKPGAALPAGATAIRLCPVRGVELGDGVVPRDALVRDTDVVVQAYNELPIATQQAVCTADLGPSYTMVFQYEGGAAVTLRGDLSGCGPVGGRTGARTLVNAFLRELRKQRSTTPPPRVTVQQPCSLTFGWMTADVTRLRAGAACSPERSRPLRPETVALLGTDLAAARPAGQASSAPSPLPVRVVDEYGQPLELWWQGDRVSYGDDATTVALSPRTVAALRADAGR